MTTPDANRMFHCFPLKSWIMVRVCRANREKGELRQCRHCTQAVSLEAGEVPTKTPEEYLAGAPPAAPAYDQDGRPRKQQQEPVDATRSAPMAEPDPTPAPAENVDTPPTSQAEERIETALDAKLDAMPEAESAAPSSDASAPSNGAATLSEEDNTKPENPDPTRVGSRQREVLQAIADAGGKATRRHLQAALQVNTNTVGGALRSLRRHGLAESHNRSRDWWWELTDAGRQTLSNGQTGQLVRQVHRSPPDHATSMQEALDWLIEQRRADLARHDPVIRSLQEARDAIAEGG